MLASPLGAGTLFVITDAYRLYSLTVTGLLRLVCWLTHRRSADTGNLRQTRPVGAYQACLLTRATPSRLHNSMLRKT